MPKEENALPRIPTKSKYPKTADRFKQFFGVFKGANEVVSKIFRALKLGSENDQFNMTYVSATVDSILYLFNFVTFVRTKNKNIEKNTNLALDSIKLALGIAGVIGLAISAPIVIPIFGSIFIFAAILDLSLSFVGLIYNVFKVFSSSDHEKKEHYWNKTKGALAKIALMSVMLSLIILGTAITIIAEPITYVIAGVTSILWAKSLTETAPGKALSKRVKEKFSKNNPKVDEKSENKDKQDALLKKAKFEVLNFSEVDQHKAFSLLDQCIPLIDQSIDGNDKLAKKESKVILKNKPTFLKRFNKYDEFVIAKKMPLNDLKNRIVDAGGRIMSEYNASFSLHNRHSQKRLDKVQALQDLQFILVQLDAMKKESKKPKTSTLFLSFNQVKNAQAENKGAISTLSFSKDDLQKNKDKVWKKIKLYFDETYPKYENSFFKETGEVKSLFESAEAWVKQKSVDEFKNEINKLHGKYTAKYDEVPTQEQTDKQNALDYLSKFLDKMNVLNNPDALERALKKKKVNKTKYVFSLGDDNRMRLFYDKEKERVFYRHPSIPEDHKGLDLSKPEDKKQFAKWVLNDAVRRYPSLASSVEGSGKVAGMFNDVSKWVQLQDLSHLSKTEEESSAPATPSQAGTGALSDLSDALFYTAANPKYKDKAPHPATIQTHKP